jgi:hypothetical protein
MDQVAGQPEPVAEPSIVLGPTQDEQLFGSFGKWARVAHPNKELLPPKFKAAQ